MPLQITKEGYQDGSRFVALKGLGPFLTGKIIRCRGCIFSRTQSAGGIQWPGIGECQRVERQGGDVTSGATDIGKVRIARCRRFPPCGAFRLGNDGRLKGCLPRHQRGYIGGAGLVYHSVLIEIRLTGPAFAETLAGLYTVMAVQRIDGELAKGGDDAFLAERANHQIGIHAVEAGEVHHAVCLDRDGAE